MSPAPTPPLHAGRPRTLALAILALLLVPLAARAGDPQPPTAAPANSTLPEPPLIETGEVTVTATRREENVLDVPGNVTVLTRKQIEASGARDVPDLLRRQAGILVINTTGNREGYSVESRGFNNGGGNGSSTLVLVDGRRMNRAANDNTDWSFIPLDNVERIEITRGPSSAIWGDNAIGGVIQIITRHGQRREDGLDVSLRGKAGNLHTNGGTLFAEGRQGPFQISTFLEHDHEGFYRKQSEFKANTGELGLGFDLGARGHVGFKAGYSDTRRDRPGSLTLAQAMDDPRQARPDAGGDQDRTRFRYVQMPVDLSLAEGLTAQIMPWYDRRTDAGSVSGAAFSFATNDAGRRLGLNAHLTWRHEILGFQNTLTAGADFRWERVTQESRFVSFGSLFPSDDQARRSTTGTYLQEELWLLDNLQLSTGIRRDAVDSYARASRFDFSGNFLRKDSLHDHRHKWSPRAALTWRPLPWLSSWLSWSRGFRFPNVDEQFGFFGIDAFLRPESSQNFEVGLKARHALGSFNLVLYHMDVDDEIFFDPQAGSLFCPPPAGPCGSNANLDRVKHQGLEISAKITPVSWLELYGSYSLEDVKIRSDHLTGLANSRLPINPVNRGTVGGRLHLPAGFEVGLNANLVGQRILANDLPNRFPKLGHYTTLDGRLAWTHALTEWLGVEFSGVVYNMTDKAYAEFGGVSTLDGRLGLFPSPKRHFVTSVRITVRR